MVHLSMDSSSSVGVLYLAFGAPYLEEARRSAGSVKTSNPGLKICIVTDQPEEPGEIFDVVLPFEEKGEVQSESYLALDRVAYYRKIQPLLRSPFERTLFLDSDTWVCGSLSGVFDLLEKFEVLVTPVFITRDYAFEEKEMPFAAIPEAFGYFNSGFLAFRRCPAVVNFIQRWQENYEQHTAQFTVNDQPALRLTLFEGVVDFHVVPPQFNTVSWVPFLIPGGGKVVMLHGRNPWLQRWAGHLKASRTTMVGSFSMKHLAVYHGARVLYAAQRFWKKLTGKNSKKNG